jgi:peptidoglycan/xylan/chitin deacetylase (PgdA/CDA1 family)
VPVAPAITVKQADTTKKIVALTFDAGADTGYAAQILDILKQKGIKATFGMTGVWAEQNPDLLKRMVAEGHQIINHTYDHKSFTGFSTGEKPLTTQQRDDELTRLHDIVKAQTGYEVKPYFRPPYGDIDGSVLQDVADAGYSVNVMWSLDTLGWNGLTADEIVKRTMDGVTPGGIILMHVGAQSQDAIALPRIIQQLRDEGYSFVTVKQMVGR